MDTLLTLNVFSASLSLALGAVLLCGALIVWRWLRGGAGGDGSAHP